MVDTKDKDLQIRINVFVQRGWVKTYDNGYVCWHNPKNNAFIKIPLEKCPMCYKMDLK